MVFTEYIPLLAYSDGVLTIGLQPPTAIGGFSLEAKVTKRFRGESGLITKYCSSGNAAGASGITVVNSGQGIFNVSIRESNTSGIDPGTYALQVKRTDSGLATVLVQGWVVLLPN